VATDPPVSTRTTRDQRGTPRMRDVPPPRENPSVTGPLFRWLFQWPYRVALYGLYRAGFRPWQLTMLSLIGNTICGLLLLTGQRFLPGILLLPAGLFDIFDGGVARLRGEDSRKGALLDAVIDRASDIIVFGCLVYAESAVHGEVGTAGAALAAMVTSLLVSHVRAEGEAAGLEMREGSVQRLERYTALMFGLTAPRMLLPVLVALALAGLLTTFQRAAAGWKGLRPDPRAAAR
jgi:CDP-diacylglycerol--glycerol-3-phosphate 3-phosphatidyltransferase